MIIPQFCLTIALLLLPLYSFAFSNSNSAYDSLYTIYKSEQDLTVKVELLDELHNLVLYKDVDLAKEYALEQLSIAEQLRDDHHIGAAYYNMGNYFKNTGKKDSATYYLQKAKLLYEKEDYLQGIVEANRIIAIIELAKGNSEISLDIIDNNLIHRMTLNDSSGLASDYNLKGGIYEHQGNIELALVNVMKALKLYEQIGNRVGKADALLVLSALENAQDNFEKMLEYELEALNIYQEENDLLYSALTKSSIGGTYNNMKQFEKSQPYLLSAIQMAEKLQSVDILGDAKTKLGKSYIKTHKFKEAIKILKEALVHNQENDRPLNQIRNLNGLGLAYQSQNKHREAIEYLNQSIELGEIKNAVEPLYQAYALRAASNKQLENFKSAYEDQIRYKKLQDSIYNANKIAEIERMRTAFDTKRKEQALELEKSKVILLENEAKVNFLQKSLLGVGLGLSLLLAFLIFYISKQKIKHSQLKNEKLDAELNFKKKELTTHALHLAKKNEFLEGLKGKAEALKSSNDVGRGYQQLIRSINFDLQDDNNWKNFSHYFEEVHPGFNKAAVVKFPSLTPNDLRLMALLKMNLSSKEMANILNISIPGIKKARQRLRKKMSLDSKEPLGKAILEIM